MDIYNILFTGLTYQGIQLLHTILMEYANKIPFIKKVSGEYNTKTFIRQNSCLASIRYLIESRIYSLEQDHILSDPLPAKIPNKETHLVFGLDPLQTFKSLKFYSEKTVIVLNTHKYPFVQGRIGLRHSIIYPSLADIVDILDQLVRKIIAVDLYEISTSLFESQGFEHMLMLGIAIKEFTEFYSNKQIALIIREKVKDPEKLIHAFEYGYNLISD